MDQSNRYADLSLDEAELMRGVLQSKLADVNRSSRRAS